MTWLAWRQFRVQASVAAALLLLTGIALALTGPHLVHLYDTSVRHCQAQNDCGTARLAFLRSDKLLQRLSTVLLVLPALIGIFWGAPLVAREIESGTFQLAWTQSVTRTKWLLVKFGVVGIASVIVTGLFSLMVTWWSSPLDRLRSAPFDSFDHRDLAPVGYAVFALALGVAAGLVIRRSVPAMAATLAGFVVVRISFSNWVRTHLLAPVHVTSPLIAPPITTTGPVSRVPAGLHPGDWVISDTTINAQGHAIGQFGGVGPNGQLSINPVGNTDRFYFAGVGRCPNRFPSQIRKPSNSHLVQQAMQSCINHFHLREVFTYQPASRFWAIQWFEVTGYLALALALTGFCVWQIRRRLN